MTYPDDGVTFCPRTVINPINGREQKCPGSTYLFGDKVMIRVSCGRACDWICDDVRAMSKGFDERAARKASK